MRQMAVHGFTLLLHAVQKPFDESRFADAAGAREHPERTMLEQVLQPRESFIHTGVFSQRRHRRVFREGLAL